MKLNVHASTPILRAIATGALLAMAATACSDNAPPVVGDVPATEGETSTTGPQAISIDVLPDDAGGWNIHAKLTDFELNPRAAGSGHVEGEGHLHVYLDGEKHARMYTEWYYLSDLTPGKHDIRVAITSNDHAAYVVDDQPTSANVSIDVPTPPDDGYPQSSFDLHTAPEDMTVTLEVAQDHAGGWNAFIETTGFQFAPQNVGGDHINGEGYGHIYIDGIRINRIYGNSYHFDHAVPGTHTVSVGLITNDHRQYAIAGVAVEDSAEISIPEEDDQTDHTLKVTVGEDGIRLGVAEAEIDRGDTVKIVVSSPEGDHIHLHGYDLTAETSPHGAELSFTADIPGVFELELERSHTMVLELTVR